MPEAIIETAIGLFFVFMLMSLLCPQLVEWIAGFRQWRANALEHRIRSTLSEPNVKAKLDHRLSSRQAGKMAGELSAASVFSVLELPVTKLISML